MVLHFLPSFKSSLTPSGLQFLDKTTLGYSSVFGIIKDNKLEGQDYAWASSIFYFGYMLAEYPGVALMQRFPIAKFLGSA